MLGETEEDQPRKLAKRARGNADLERTLTSVGYRNAAGVRQRPLLMSSKRKGNAIARQQQSGVATGMPKPAEVLKGMRRGRRGRAA